MDRAITQPVGDLGKVHVIIADHLLGGINFQPDKIINNAAVVKGFTAFTTAALLIILSG